MMQSANTSNPLVGAWKRISFQFESEGTDERFDAYDKHPQGFAMMSAFWSRSVSRRTKKCFSLAKATSVDAMHKNASFK
jgi:hypothetical protein